MYCGINAYNFNIYFFAECVSTGENRTMGYEEEYAAADEAQPETEAVAAEAAEEVPEKNGEGAYIATGIFSLPLDGRLTSKFGQRWGRLHGGIDIASGVGTPIKASDSGEVIFAGDCGSYGLLVKLDHKNGYVTYYAHCSEIKVSSGDLIKKGETIALVGSTGNSTGPHCHFEIRYNNEPQNPLQYVKI